MGKQQRGRKAKQSIKLNSKDDVLIIELLRMDNKTLHEKSKTHAENILLSMLKKSNPTWILPEDSKYIFQDGNLIIKSSIRDIKDSKEQE